MKTISEANKTDMKHVALEMLDVHMPMMIAMILIKRIIKSNS